MVVRDGLRLTLLGVALGVPCALTAGGLLRSFLFGVGPWDPTTLVVASAFFVIVGAVAGCWPALRAAGINPVTALRGH